MLVVNASNIDKDWNWISTHNEFGVKMTNISDATSLLAVQGPKATATLQKLTSVNLAEISYYHFSQGDFAGCKDVILSATGYTGAGGFELYVPNESAATVWNKIIEAGAEFGIQPIGLGARDTLRLEMGFCLYGNDINDTTNPIEAGLGWITKFTKSFVGDQFAKDLKENGSKRKLVGIQMIDRGIPRHDYEVIDASGNKIGIVTSGSQTPSLDVSIGLAYIDIPHNKLDTEIYIKIRENSIKAKVVKMPFYQKTN
jgi:aminomethyltransferase